MSVHQKWRAALQDIISRDTGKKSKAFEDAMVALGRSGKGRSSLHHAIETVLAVETGDSKGAYSTYILQPFLDISSGRNLFITEAGQLGIGPKGAKAGDMLFALAGGDIPFIARPRTGVANHYKLVGEAYVDGLMEGDECIDLLSEEEASSRELEDVILV